MHQHQAKLITQNISILIAEIQRSHNLIHSSILTFSSKLGTTFDIILFFTLSIIIKWKFPNVLKMLVTDLKISHWLLSHILISWKTPWIKVLKHFIWSYIVKLQLLWISLFLFILFNWTFTSNRINFNMF